MIPYSIEALELLQRGTLALSRVEANGIRVDVRYLERTLTKTGLQIKGLQAELASSDVVKQWRRTYRSKTNLESPVQLGKVLFEIMGFPSPGRTEGGHNHKTDEDALATVDHPFVKDYLAIKKLQKGCQFLEGIRAEVCDGLLHPTFNLNIARTYRSSSDSPNFQNMPVRNATLSSMVRRCIRARPRRRLIEIDYGGIEVRVACCYHQDPTMIRYIEDPTTDMHRDMAIECYALPPDTPADYWAGKETGKKTRYCNPPEAPIWMADFSFKPLGDVKVGDRVMGWVRGHGPKGKRGNARKRKRMAASVVTHVSRRRAPIVKVTLESGRTVRCTADHQWFNGNLQYRGKDVYRPAKVGQYLAHVVEPLGECPSGLKRIAGWLSGMMDGEGTWPNIAQCFDHNPETFARLQVYAGRLGFPFSVDYHKNASGVRLLGGLASATKFLNWCKPAKKARIQKNIMNRSSFFKKDLVVSIEPDGEGDVIGLTTSTGNYVAWGYASKNCAKNMFVFPQFYGSWWLDCSRNLWNACTTMKLVAPDGRPMQRWLARKGIKSLGAQDRDNPHPLPGTFEHHLQVIERKFWDKRFAVYARWKRTWFAAYQEKGWFLTKTGFICQGHMSRNDVINYPVQGSAFHCLLWALIELQAELERRGLRTKIVGQIHDSLLLDVPEDEVEIVLPLARKIMVTRLRKHWPWITTPLEIEAEMSPVGGSWYEKEAVKL